MELWRVDLEALKLYTDEVTEDIEPYVAVSTEQTESPSSTLSCSFKVNKSKQMTRF